MMKNKKLFAILTLVCFMFTLMPVAVFAEGEVTFDPNAIKSEAELKAAVKNGETAIKLGADIELTESFIVTSNLEIDLNGNTISADLTDKAGDGVFHVTAGTLTISDTVGTGMVDGNSNSRDDYHMAVWADGGNVIINGGKYTNEEVPGADDQYDLIYAKNATITINGGEFACKTAKWTLNTKDNNGTILVKGGSFKNYNPAEVYTEPTQPKSFVASGYYSVKASDGITYNVEAVNAAAVKSEAELKAAVKNGETAIKLGANIELTESFIVTSNLEIDLNGNTISADLTDKAGDGVFHVTAGTLTISDTVGTGMVDGNSNSRDDYHMAVWADGGNVIINGGKYTNEEVPGADDQYDLIYAKNATITINGGEFACKTAKWTLNTKDNNGTILVKGGSFKNYNPAEVYTEPTQPKSFVASGYYSVKASDGITYNVEAVNAAAVKSEAELKAAVKNGETAIKLGADIELTESFIVTSNLEIDLNGNTISADLTDKAGDGVFHVTAGTLTISDTVGTGMVDGNSNSRDDYHMAVWADGGNVIINGGKYTNEEVPGADDQYDLIYAKNATITINGGEFACKTAKWTLNTKDNNGTILVKGGSFKNYNPAEVYTEPTQPKSFVASGYYSVKASDGITYNVEAVNAAAVKSEAELKAAVKNGETAIKLGANIELTESFIVTSNLEIDLNGNTISADLTDKAGDGVFHVTAGTLTISDTVGTGMVDGNSNSRDDYHMAVWADGGNVIINGGKYTNEEVPGADDQYDLIYAKNATITINGGEFACKTAKWTLNTKDNNGTILVKGGSFKNYNPAEVYTEPTQPKSFVASGYHSVETSGTYTVAAHDFTSKYDANGHWTECVCNAKTDAVAHVYDNASDTTCNGCAYTRTVSTGGGYVGGFTGGGSSSSTSTPKVETETTVTPSGTKVETTTETTAEGTKVETVTTTTASGETSTTVTATLQNGSAVTNNDAAVDVEVEKVSYATMNKAEEAVKADETVEVVGTVNNAISVSATNAATGAVQESFTQPMSVSVPVNNSVLNSVEDTSKLTLAKVVTNADGTTSLEYMGGSYDEETGTFNAKVDEDGDYILVEKSDLVKIELTIGSTDVLHNDQATKLDVAPTIDAAVGRTELPLRYLGEALGFGIEWDNNVVTITKDGVSFSLTIGQEIPGYGTPYIDSDRTMVSARYISEMLGANVIWDPAARQVIVVK